MVNKEILEGLRMAISNGEPLKYAMSTFYNAGYNKQEVEEAAKTINNEDLPSVNKFQESVKQGVEDQTSKQQKQIPQSQTQAPQQESAQNQKTSNQNHQSQTPEQPQKQPTKKPKVSEYGSEQEKKKNPLKRKKIIIVVLIIVLCILLASIAALFIFRESIINYLMEPI